MIQLRYLVLLCFLPITPLFAETLLVSSPDKRITLSLSNTEAALATFRRSRCGVANVKLTHSNTLCLTPTRC